MKIIFFPSFIGAVLSWLLISCQAPVQTVEPAEPATLRSQKEHPSFTSTPPPPTVTGMPEPTATIGYTATPETQIFRDDLYKPAPTGMELGFRRSGEMVLCGCKVGTSGSIS